MKQVVKKMDAVRNSTFRVSKTKKDAGKNKPIVCQQCGNPHPYGGRGRCPECGEQM